MTLVRNTGSYVRDSMYSLPTEQLESTIFLPSQQGAILEIKLVEMSKSDEFVRGLQMAMKRLGVSWYIWAMEAWVSCNLNYDAPSQDPERRDALVIAFQDLETGLIGNQQTLLTRANGMLAFEDPDEWIVADGDRDVRGRFIGLLGDLEVQMPPGFNRRAARLYADQFVKLYRTQGRPRQYH